MGGCLLSRVKAEGLNKPLPSDVMGGGGGSSFSLSWAGKLAQLVRALG